MVSAPDRGTRPHTNPIPREVGGKSARSFLEKSNQGKILFPDSRQMQNSNSVLVYLIEPESIRLICGGDIHKA